MTNSELAQFLEECAENILNLVHAESFGGWRQRRSRALECADRMKQEAQALRLAKTVMDVKFDLKTRVG